MGRQIDGSGIPNDDPGRPERDHRTRSRRARSARPNEIHFCGADGIRTRDPHLGNPTRSPARSRWNRSSRRQPLARSVRDCSTRSSPLHWSSRRSSSIPRSTKHCPQSMSADLRAFGPNNNTDRLRSPGEYRCPSFCVAPSSGDGRPVAWFTSRHGQRRGSAARAAVGDGDFLVHRSRGLDPAVGPRARNDAGGGGPSRRDLA